uniref:NADH-ubiquinone oxidoreductase chain 1 n=1 Tax=Songthela sp. TaxID=2946135 RepID=A0A8X8M1F7_9ARAC|nr:NADH dehydrogenase subunit 1 [Songthela sp.]
MKSLGVLFMLVMVLIGVAFFTLMERKVLGYIQCRKGPNKVGFMGIFQPFSDAIKLFSKEFFFLETSNMIYFYLGPILMIFLSLMLWVVLPYSEGVLDLKYGILFFFICSGMGIFSLMLVGWGSNSKFSLLGAYRGVAQMISYEVSFMFIILGLLIFTNSYLLMDMMHLQEVMWFFLGNLILLLMWLLVCLAELNRTPFDFAEGESELVSGFNVEFMGSGFAIIFMSEYSSIMMISILSVVLFFGNFELEMMSLGLFLMILVLWVRGSFPRFRYDKLMMLAWKFLLSGCLLMFIFNCSMEGVIS